MVKRYLKSLISFEALIPFAIILIIVVLVMRLLSAKTPGFKKQRKKYYAYLIFGILIMAIFVAIVYNLQQTTLMLRFYSMMVFSFIIGALHRYFYRYIFEKFDSPNQFKEILIACISSLPLMIPVILIASYFNDLQYLWYYLLITLAFVLPTVFFVLFNYSVGIPVKLYSKWYYPLSNKYELPKHYELKNMIILNFMFYKSTQEAHMTSFKAKAPKNMDFGRLFFFFINDYNDKKTTTKIELTEDSGDPHGWYFYTKPKWFGASRHIDPELTVEQNNLEDSDVVICQRI